MVTTAHTASDGSIEISCGECSKDFKYTGPKGAKISSTAAIQQHYASHHSTITEAEI